MNIKWKFRDRIYLILRYFRTDKKRKLVKIPWSHDVITRLDLYLLHRLIDWDSQQSMDRPSGYRCAAFSLAFGLLQVTKPEFVYLGCLGHLVTKDKLVPSFPCLRDVISSTTITKYLVRAKCKNTFQWGFTLWVPLVQQQTTKINETQIIRNLMQLNYKRQAVRLYSKQEQCGSTNSYHV